MSKREKFILALLVLFPVIPWMLMQIDYTRGLIWFSVQAIYYLPVSWIGEPLFTRSSDVGMVPNSGGRVLTGAVYSAVFLFTTRVFPYLRKPTAKR